MILPESFIMTSDFPTLKNNGTGDATITIPGSATVPDSGYLEWHTDIIIAGGASIFAARIQSSKNSNKWVRANQLLLNRTGYIPVAYFYYTLVAYAYRLDSTTLRCQVLLQNPYSSILTSEPGTETFNFHFNTFIPPFA